MPWFNVDDGSTFHPKVLMAGNAAWGAFTRLGAYAAKHVTEGFVPDEIVRMVTTKGELAKLLAVEFLHQVDGGVQLHDYLDYNRDAETVARSRAKAAERQRRKRDRERDSHGVTDRVTDAVSHEPQDQAKPRTTRSRDSLPPRHGSPGGGGTVDNRRTAIAAAYAALALDKAKKAGTAITSDDGYMRTAKGTCLARIDLDRYVAAYPDAPADAVAAWLHGEKHSMRYYTAVDPAAPDAEVVDLAERRQA